MLSNNEKSALVSKLADEMIEALDWDSMKQLAYEALLNGYDSMDDNDLLNFIDENAPHLLEEV